MKKNKEQTRKLKGIYGGLIMLVAIVMAMVSCKQQVIEKDYLSISGEISNAQADYLELFAVYFDMGDSPEDKGRKRIKINKDGTFSAKLNIKNPGSIYINYADDQAYIFVRNGYDLHLKWDDNEKNDDGFLPLRSIEFSGHGSDICTYYYALSHEKPSGFLGNDDRFKLNKADFEQKLDAASAEKLNAAPKSDTIFTAYYKKELNDNKKFELRNYETKQYMLTTLGKGMPSPKFTDYENVDGKKISLDDFKGKYVYMDIWATWCVPCIREIPDLKKLEAAYHDKNIEFVSMSIDVQTAKDKWKKMVADKELGGIQLIEDTEKSAFTDAYKVQGIPHFILIDPAGNIVASEAPRPSDKKAIKALFDPLNL